jgi:thiamine-phosphate pyrophosphorylase
VAEKRARLNLARAAAKLAAPHRLALPSLILITDDDRLPDPAAAARALPRGSMVIVRAREAVVRAKLAETLLSIARGRYLFVLIADDPALAAQMGVDGLHLPEAKAYTAAHWRALHPRWLITVASHGRRPVPDAADAALLSAIFPTRSHSGRAALGPLKAACIAQRLRKPVYALGGIDANNAGRLAKVFAGIAAIGALAT